MKFLTLLFFIFATLQVKAQSPWYYGSGTAVNLENAIQYKNGVKNITGSLDPSVTPVNAPAGSLYESTNGKLYVKQDAGSTTNWFTLSPSLVNGAASSVDGQIVLFDGVTGKLIKAATGTGFVKATAGVYSTQALIDLTTDVTGVLPIANGGTGSNVQNFVDLTTNQTIDGTKDFLDAINTDDVIFNDAAYSSLTLKRTLSHQMATGVVDGAIMTINADPTKFDISQQYLAFSDYSVSSDLPEVKYVTCPALAAQTVTNIAVADTSYISVDDTCAIFQSTTFPTQIERRTRAFVGRLAHINHVTLNTAATLPDFVVDTNSQLYDLFDAIGAFTVSGNILSPNGANLSFNKSAGVNFRRSVGYATNKQNPNTIISAAQILVSFVRLTQTSLIPGPFTTIDPAVYDVAGVETAVPNPPSTSTNKRVYLFSNGQIAVQHGQTLYTGLSEAVAGIASETFVVNPTAADGGILIGVISCRKGATDLSNTADCRLTRVGKFDNSGVTAGSAATTTLQQAYNNSVTPQITTTTALGSVDFRRGSAADSDNVFRIQNGAGTTTMAVTGAGDMSANSLTLVTPLALSSGGTNKNMTAVNGGVVWTDADSQEVTAAGTSGQVLQSNGAAAPTWVTLPTGALPVTTKTANYTILITDKVIKGDATGGAFTLTLPAASTYTGFLFYIKKIDSSANAVIIDGDSTETIDGALTYSITDQYHSLTIFSNGTGWDVL